MSQKKSIIPEMPTPSQTCIDSVLSKREKLISYLESKELSVQEAVSCWFRDCKMAQYPSMPCVKRVKIEESALVISRLFVIDGYDTDTIIKTLDYSIQNKFWRDVLISLASVRKKKEGDDLTKFDKVAIKASEVSEVKSEDDLGRMAWE